MYPYLLTSTLHSTSRATTLHSPTLYCTPVRVGTPYNMTTSTTQTKVNANSKSPMLFTTATNDGAFWPAPHTAEHELGCFNKARAGEQSIPPRSFSKLSGPVAFVQVAAKACAEDGKVRSVE